MPQTKQRPHLHETAPCANDEDHVVCCAFRNIYIQRVALPSERVYYKRKHGVDRKRYIQCFGWIYCCGWGDKTSLAKPLRSRSNRVVLSLRLCSTISEENERCSSGTLWMRTVTIEADEVWKWTAQIWQQIRSHTFHKSTHFSREGGRGISDRNELAFEPDCYSCHFAEEDLPPAICTFVTRHLTTGFKVCLTDVESEWKCVLRLRFENNRHLSISWGLEAAVKKNEAH